MAIMEWFKINGYNLIYGSLRLDPPTHQLVFIKLLAMCSISRVPGVVCIANKVPYPMNVLATTLSVSEKELKEAIEYNCKPEQARLKINSWEGIEVVNWPQYQSKSYLRVKKHREKKRTEEEEKRIEQRASNGGVTVSNDIVTKFNRFWEIYPRKIGKGAAKKAFGKINPDNSLFARIMVAVDQQRNSIQWQREEGRFIPLPTTWLNQERWDDVLPHKETSREQFERMEKEGKV